MREIVCINTPTVLTSPEKQIFLHDPFLWSPEASLAPRPLVSRVLTARSTYPPVNVVTKLYVIFEICWSLQCCFILFLLLFFNIEIACGPKGNKVLVRSSKVLLNGGRHWRKMLRFVLSLSLNLMNWLCANRMKVIIWNEGDWLKGALSYAVSCAITLCHYLPLKLWLELCRELPR